MSEVKPLDRVEVYRLIRAAETPRDRGFISSLYLTAARISEILKLRKNDLKLIEYNGSKYIIVRLETLKRREYSERLIPIPLEDVFTAPILRYLRCVERGDARLYPFTRRWGHRTVREAAVRAGVRNGHVWPHLLRHSRITELAPHLSQIELAIYAGWALPKTLGPMRRYIHLDWRSYAHKIPVQRRGGNTLPSTAGIGVEAHPPLPQATEPGEVMGDA